MRRVYWGEPEVSEELRQLEGDKLALEIVEIRQEGNRVSYELRVGKLAIVVGSAEKDTNRYDSVVSYRLARARRRRLSTILDTPQDAYKRQGEKVLAGLSTREFYNPEGLHISPQKELELLVDVFNCGQAIGFDRITRIGRTDVTADTLRRAKEHLGKESQNRVQDLVESVYEAL